MDYRRATEIYVPVPGDRGRVGTGYIVTSGLILTALHVVGELHADVVCAARCWVRPLGHWNSLEGQWLAQTAKIEDSPPIDQGWAEAELCWPPIGLPPPAHQPLSGYCRSIDLALLRITDDSSAAWVMDSTRVQFGIGGFDEQFDCHAIGFPQMMMRTVDGKRLRDLTSDERQRSFHSGDLIADSFELRGTIRRANAIKDYQFHVHVNNETPDDAELWRGLSGAALFDSDERIIGVIAECTSESRHGALVAEPIAIARDRADFVDLLDIDLTLANLNPPMRQLMPAARDIAQIVHEQSEQAFGRSLLSSLLDDNTTLTPSKIFIRPEFRRKPGGSLLISRQSELNAPLDLVDVIGQQEAVLVIGEAGSGKSFAAADLARRLAEPWIAGKVGTHVPLLVIAKDLPTSETKIALGDVLASAFRASTNQGTFPENLLSRAVSAQLPVLVIIDGVDEIVGDEGVRKFLNWINSTVKAASHQLGVVLFTRPLGLDPIAREIDQFSPFLLLPFDHSRRRELAQGIYSLLGRDERYTDRFLSHVESQPIASLLDNPAIVTMLAIVYSHSAISDQPETRSDVISKYIRLLALSFKSRHEPEFTRYVDERLYGREFLIPNFVNERDQNVILSYIGFLATSADAIDDTFFAMLFIKCKESGLFSEAKHFDTERYADLLKQFFLRIGILTENRGRLAFGHNLIREYLAAIYLTNLDGPAAEQWLRRWRAPRWRETLLMVIPLWLRRPECAECVLSRLRSIATSTYDGALFCGEALLEHLPISKDDHELLTEAALSAVRSWNICENVLSTVPNTNPSGLIRRLLLLSNIRSKIISYLENLHSNYCPFSVAQLVRLLSDLDEPNTLQELARSGTPFIRAYAARALLDRGDEESAISAVFSVLSDHTSSIRLCRQLIDALAEAGANGAMSRIANNLHIDTSVRINAAAYLWSASPSDQSREVLAATFFGSAHDDDVDPAVIDALVESKVIWSPTNQGNVAPATLRHVAQRYLGNQRSTRCEEAEKLARELLAALVLDPTSSITALSVADFVEPVLGRDDLKRLLLQEAEGRSLRDQLPYAGALIRLGDYTMAIELEEQDNDETCRVEARKLLKLPDGQGQEQDQISELSAYPAARTAAALDVRIHAYEANPTDDAYREMLDAELIDSRSPEPRYRAAYFVSRALYRTGHGDLLRKRLADSSQPPKARATALEMLARLGDSEIIVTQLTDPSLPPEILAALPEALELIGLQEHLPDIRSRIALDPQSDPNAREVQFRALIREDHALAERIAVALVDDPTQLRLVRRWPLIYLGAKFCKAIDQLAAFAGEEPASCGDILYDLANTSPFCTGAALAVLRATSPAPLLHMHVLNRLLRGFRSSEEVSLLMELAERVDFNCEGHADVLCRLSEVMKEQPGECTKTQQQILAGIAAAKLCDPRATGMASAAILLWHISDQAYWMDAIVAAIESIPDRYGVLTSELSIPVEIRTELARRLAGTNSFDVRLLAAIELCEVGQMEEGCSVFRDLFALDDVMAKLSWKRALYGSAFVDAISRFSLGERLGDEIASILVATISAWGPLPLTPRVHSLFGIVLRFAIGERREELLRLFQSMEDTLVKSLWDAAETESRGEFLDALQRLWFICLRIPDQPWLRLVARGTRGHGRKL